MSGDARLALLIACLGFLVVSIPICAALAIALGYLGRRKRARFATLAMAVGAVELIVFGVIVVVMQRGE